MTGNDDLDEALETLTAAATDYRVREHQARIAERLHEIEPAATIMERLIRPWR